MEKLYNQDWFREEIWGGGSITNIYNKCANIQHRIEIF